MMINCRGDLSMSATLLSAALTFPLSGESQWSPAGVQCTPLQNVFQTLAGNCLNIYKKEKEGIINEKVYG